jgi:hypothetical protein
MTQVTGLAKRTRTVHYGQNEKNKKLSRSEPYGLVGSGTSIISLV